MTSLGEAVIEIGADTSHFRKDTKRGVKEANLEAEGKKAGTSFSKGFSKNLNLGKSSSFSQLTFSLSKVALGAVAAAGAIVPVGPALGGVASAAVAVTGAVGLASGTMLSGAAAASSLGLAAITTKVGLGGLTDATKAQAKAQEEMAKTGKVSDATAQELAFTMNKLSPAAREVVKQTKALGSVWMDLRQNVQQSLLTGVADSMKQVSDAVLPVLNKRLGQSAALLSINANRFGDWASSAQGVSMIDKLLVGLNKSLVILLPALGDIGNGLLNLFIGSTGPAASLSFSLALIAERFREWSAEVVKSGDFARFLHDSADAAGALLGVLGNLGGVLRGVFGAGADEGVGLLENFRLQTQALENLVKSAEGQTALESFFSLTGVAAQAFADVLSVLSPVLSGLGAVFSALSPALDALRVALLPVAQIFGYQLGEALTILAPILGTLGMQLASLVTFLQPIAPLVLPLVLAFFAWSKATAALTLVQAAYATAMLGSAAATQAGGLSLAIYRVQAVAAAAATGVARVATLAWTAATLAWTAVTAAARGVMVAMAAAQLAYNIAGMKGVATLVAQAAATVAMAAISKVVMVATKAWAAAQWLINAALTANPIGIVIVAIGALVAGLVLAYKKSETFRNIVNASFKAVGEAAKFMWEKVIRPVLEFFGDAIKWLVDKVADLLHALGNVPGFGWAKDAANQIRDAADAAVGFARSIIAIPDSKTVNVSIVTRILRGDKDPFQMGALGQLKKNFAKAQQAQSDQLAAAANAAAASAASSAASSVPMAAGGGGSGGSKTVSPAKRAMKELGQLLTKALVRSLVGGREDITSALNSLLEKAKETTRKNLVKLVTSARRELMPLADAFDDLRKRMDEALNGDNGLNTLTKQAADLFSSVVDQAVGLGNVTSFNDTFEGIVAGMTEATLAVGAFNEVIQSLKSAGLNNTAIEQLLAKGPVEGIAAARAILDSGAAGIGQLNELQAQLTSASEALGNTAKNSLYAAGIAAAEGLVAGLKSQEDQLRQQMENIAEAMIKALKKKLRSNSPSKEFEDIAFGGIGGGLEKGLSRARSGVQKGVRELIPLPGESGGSSTSTTNNYNRRIDQTIVVPTDDPEATAMSVLNGLVAGGVV